MSNKLSRKKAVVTAASQGIGRETSVAFAEEGATVWATDINNVALGALSGGRPEMVTGTWMYAIHKR
jgi:2-keto-3-deoxy-L-fuconate dehydrogenase